MRDTLVSVCLSASCDKKMNISSATEVSLQCISQMPENYKVLELLCKGSFGIMMNHVFESENQRDCSCKNLQNELGGLFERFKQANVYVMKGFYNSLYYVDASWQ